MKRLLGIGLVSFWLTSCMLQPDTLSQVESALEKPSQFESVLEEPSSTGSQVACTQDDPSTRSPTQASSLVANLNTLGIDLYISAAIQQATITVDEQGTEAAAATGIPMPVSKVEPAELIVNRPFIYAIRETESNAILFLGRVVNPVSY